VIVGLGIDVVDIERFAASLGRTPALLSRLFTEEEQRRSPPSLAARFAAKEALAKALGAPTGLAWLDAEVINESTGEPNFELRGSVLARAHEVGARTVHVSLSHDAGIASAVVVLES
jgi:holo-[acyl-carrier protein] synthase